MPRESYQDQLEQLRDDVVAMAELTLERYETAVEVLETGDRELAERVITGDHDINERYLALESDCIELFALQQPVAGDLRFVASSFKIITDLERVGDLATNLARYGREANGTFSVEVAPLARTASDLVTDAVEAYRTEDADAARAVAGRDDMLDERCLAATETVVRELVTTEAVAVESTLERTPRALLTIRDVERVGDHAVNICARTLYMVEHSDALLY